MSEKERMNIIECLVWIHGWSRSAYEKMTDEELNRMYEQEWKRRG